MNEKLHAYLWEHKDCFQNPADCSLTELMEVYLTAKKILGHQIVGFNGTVKTLAEELQIIYKNLDKEKSI